MISFLAIVKNLIMCMFIVRVRCAIQTLFPLQQNIDIGKGHGNVWLVMLCKYNGPQKSHCSFKVRSNYCLTSWPIYCLHLLLSAETESSDGELNIDVNGMDDQVVVNNIVMNDSSSDDTCFSSPGSTSSRASDELGCVHPTADRHSTLESPLTNPEETEIVAAILEALNLVDQMQGSHKDFIRVLEFAEKLWSRNYNEEDTIKAKWPKTWRETEMILKKCGYSDPKEYYICLDTSHYSKWDIMLSSEDNCKYCGKNGNIKYYYIGLPEKVKRWCSNPNMCKKMMAHWENKDRWISGSGPNFTEIWDGSRFNELSWFWNPECSWILPFRCTFCSSVISAKEIQESERNMNGYNVQCSECGTMQYHMPSFTKGNPRNIALIGHWDGWQPFGYPGSHSCGECIFFYKIVSTK